MQILGKESGNSAKQVQRYLKITELIPELLTMLDQKEISFNPAYEIAYLSNKEQKIVYDAINYVQAAPSISQAQRIRKLSEEKLFSLLSVRRILTEVKKGQTNRVMFKNEQLYQFFPRDYPPEQMKQEILRILKQWTKENGKIQTTASGHRIEDYKWRR